MGGPVSLVTSTQLDPLGLFTCTFLWGEDVPISSSSSSSCRRFCVSSFFCSSRITFQWYWCWTWWHWQNLYHLVCCLPFHPCPCWLLIFILLLPCIHTHWYVLYLLPLLMCVPPCKCCSAPCASLRPYLPWWLLWWIISSILIIPSVCIICKRFFYFFLYQPFTCLPILVSFLPLWESSPLLLMVYLVLSPREKFHPLIAFHWGKHAYLPSVIVFKNRRLSVMKYPPSTSVLLYTPFGVFRYGPFLFPWIVSAYFLPQQIIFRVYSPWVFSLLLHIFVVARIGV